MRSDERRGDGLELRESSPPIRQREVPSAEGVTERARQVVLSGSNDMRKAREGWSA